MTTPRESSALGLKRPGVVDQWACVVAIGMNASPDFFFASIPKPSSGKKFEHPNEMKD